MNSNVIITTITKHIIWKISAHIVENVLKVLELTHKSRFISQGVANLIIYHQCEDLIHPQNMCISVADCKWLQILSSFHHQEINSILHSLNNFDHENAMSDTKRAPILSLERLAVLRTLSATMCLIPS